jgi:hypothetical protein
MAAPGIEDFAYSEKRADSMITDPTTPAELLSLYRRAFERYGTQALWNKNLLDAPTREDALVVARALRIEGDREARRLAEEIERACVASL